MSKLEIFTEELDSDLAWRKKEAANLLLLHSDGNESIIIKASVLLIYSHWEGFVKNACKLYLDFVSSKSVSMSDLTKNFQAITLKGRIKEVIASSDSLTMSNELSFLDAMENDHGKKFTVSRGFRKSEQDKSIINTKDNLNYSIFTSILKIVGIEDRACLESKEVFLDEKLLSNRNKIAHGNKVDPGDDDFDMDLGEVKKLKAFIFSVMDSLTDDLKYYAENECYLKENFGLHDSYNKQSNDQLESILKVVFA